MGPRSPQHLANRAVARDLLQIIGRTNVERQVPHATALSLLDTPSNATAHCAVHNQEARGMKVDFGQKKDWEDLPLTTNHDILTALFT